jgi:hypothetical protein
MIDPTNVRERLLSLGIPKETSSTALIETKRKSKEVLL